MPNKKDISQIRKYLNGELDLRAMHGLERRAQDDPLLMDALEGYGQAGNGQQANLDELAGRLQQRTDQKVRRMSTWKAIAVAASVLIILGVGLWLITRQPNEPAHLANTIKPETSEKDVIAKQPAGIMKRDPATDLKKGYKGSIAAAKEPDRAKKQQYAAATPPLSEEQPGANTKSEKVEQKNKNYALVLKEAAINRTYPADTLKSNNSVNANAPGKKIAGAMQVLQGKADGVTITQQPTTKYKNELYSRGLVNPNQNAGKDINPIKYQQKDTAPLNEVVVSGYAAQKKKDGTGNESAFNPAQVYSGRSIKGRVIDQNDKQPVTGATVKVKGASFGAVTNIEGKFVLHNIGNNQTLIVGFIGYNSKNVNINNKDSLNIELAPSTNALNEVAVTGYAAKSSDSETVYQEPLPREGWPAFRKYISENAKSTDGSTGKVRLSFTVDYNGHLGNFKIIKSLSKIADQKATDLVQNGPVWVGATDGKQHEVKVTVKFSPL